MDLLVDTTRQGEIILKLFNPYGKAVAECKKHTSQLSENLLLEVERFLRAEKVSLNKLKKILVNPGPGGFSATRTGVAIANALAYALGIPVAEYPSGKVLKFVLPEYDKEPNITRPRKLT